MKNNISSATNYLTVGTTWFDRLIMYIKKTRGHKIDRCDKPKKTRKIK